MIWVHNDCWDDLSSQWLLLTQTEISLGRFVCFKDSYTGCGLTLEASKIDQKVPLLKAIIIFKLSNPSLINW